MKNTISYETAKSYIERFRNNRNNIEVPEFKGSLSLSETFEVGNDEVKFFPPICSPISAF